MAKLFLLIAALGVVPAGLSYGAAPSSTMSLLFAFSVESVNEAHIFRAVMGLYLASAAFWAAGAMSPSLRVPALWGVVVFMLGLAAGRILSVLVDGVPHPLLLGYILIELVMGGLALALVRRQPA